METTILKPEFFVDFDGQIVFGSVAINGPKIISAGSDLSQIKAKTITLPNQVLMPGFVNCHSHAFQRALRGKVERNCLGANKDDFWSWRSQMYALAGQLSKEELELLTLFTYSEMLEAGFTHVGEFHYLHHNDNKDPLAMSQAIAQAATSAGINLCLLECAYARHNFEQPIKAEQRRFYFEQVDNFLELVKTAKNNLEDALVSIGLAIHSVRAVPQEWFSPIGSLANKLAMPLHIHVSEQQSEVDICKKYTNLSPIALLNHHQLLTPSTTLVHATHLINDDLQIVASNQPHICICPSTEKNLGDGMAPIKELYNNAVRICIGTDQHVRLDPFDEARSLEEQERLRLFKRNILNEKTSHLYRALLPCLQSFGMSSLYPTFNDAALLGQNANLIGIELSPEYQWHGPEAALDAMLVAHQPAKIMTVITNGQMVVQQGRHQNQDKFYLIKEIGKFLRRINYI